MTSRRRQLGLVLTLPALVAPAVVMPAAPAGAAVKAPPTKSLPAALDVYVPYQGQTICDPRPRPGVVAFATLMTTHYAMGSLALIGRTCGSGPSEHYDGRAWDWMLNVNNPSQEAVAQSVLAWLTAPDKNGVQGAMARRFGIMYIIHNRKMWRSYAPERGWAPYYGSSPHTDHIHFSFNYNGAAGRTSWWTGVAQKTVLTTLPPAGTTLPSSPTTPPAPTPSTPVPTPAGVLSFGMTSAAVKTLQTRLGGLPVTGYFGSLTKARVIEYQKFVGLPQTGVADLRTQEILAQRGWRTVAAAYPTLSLGMTSAAVKVLQTKLGSVPTTGYYGTLTKARVTAYQKFVGLPQTGVADPVTQARLWVRGWTGTAAPSVTTYPTLRLGMTSAAVKTLQTKLGSLPTTGYYGTMTQARVTAYQKFAGLPQTGVADSRTQQVLYTRGWSTAAAASFTTPSAVTSAVVTPAVLTDKEPAMTTFATAPSSSSPGVAHVEVDTAYTRFKDLTLGVGSRGAAVRVLQRGLGGLAVDGVFGSVTRDKVAALQRSVAMPATGVVTPEVWEVLEARDFPFATSRSTVLREGDTGAQVVAVQRLLGIRVTGVFDRMTRDAVKTAQARAGLASTGVVASRTWSLFDRLSA
ncbi:peptidoglycan hydrolase-like protein with peptidoglycan-binding domain [Humibacillus xanthopallidus]|uniref:Peptidoglycan hydrolase-like protein with peptidoglycan-binding domain n=1 Tax=Humibacillus xanthopallidus TaxID=412689 RepID=A0A543PX30_9MICO|nr:peptidoglycan-binding protein [Humibacillus xanthopallidus]TQN48643.1 peptidoglycan hydrolase-like protein with peptidoglycan-binding domain [Humibacillus xanthopallidus]